MNTSNRRPLDALGTALLAALVVAFGVQLAGCESPPDGDPSRVSRSQGSTDAAQQASAAPRDAPTRRLDVGDPMPRVVLRAEDGGPADLATAFADGPTVVIIYRGGWCPYCTRHLAALGAVESDLHALGFRIMAISPDRPEQLRATRLEHEVGPPLLSDQDMRLATALGLAFRVDDETLRRYEGFGIDLVAASGREHRMLPVPAVLLVDTGGIIRFMHHDDDYRERLTGEAIVEAAKRVVRTGDRS